MHIAVLFGGNNSERDISIATASQVVKALRSHDHSVVAIDTATGVLSEDDENTLFKQSIRTSPPTPSELEKLHDEQTWTRLIDVLHPFDLVFIALHGSPAEDGQLQSLFELSGIKHTGSGSAGSSLAWKKDVAKEVFVQNDISTPRWLTSSDHTTLIETLGLPMIIKPIEQGSTVGITLVENADQLTTALETAHEFGAIIAEEFIKGKEVTVGVLGDKALGVGEIGINPDAIFSYESKYQGIITETFPAHLEDDIYRQAQAISLKAHQVLGLSGYSRSDLRIDENGKLWLIEVNSLPGLTATSLLPQSAAVEGISFEDLCEQICQEALK